MAEAKTNSTRVIVYVIQDLVERLEETFVAIQGQDALVCGQKDYFSTLLRDLCSRTMIRGPLTVQQKAEANEKGNVFMRDDYAVEWNDAVGSIHDLCAFVTTEMDKLDEPCKTFVVSTYANFALHRVSGIARIVVERDSSNNATEELPPVLPIHLVNYNARQFAVCLQRHKSRITASRGTDEIEKIDVQLQKLKRMYREQGSFKDAIDAYSGVHSFKDCWNPIGPDFKELRSFAGGIASVMPSTSSVEADFSLINWHKNPNSKSLTDFSLESILHCKQHARLASLNTSD